MTNEKQKRKKLRSAMHKELCGATNGKKVADVVIDKVRSTANDYLLELQKLSKTYKGRTVVNAIDLYTKHCEIVGLIGANGSGKTTTFHMIAGFFKPDSGNIIFDSKIVNNIAIYNRVHLGLCYLP